MKLYYTIIRTLAAGSVSGLGLYLSLFQNRSLTIASGLTTGAILAALYMASVNREVYNLSRKIRKSKCTKCKDTGWVPYDRDHTAVCTACCTHSRGWWDLSPEHYGYIEGADNGCCLSGCGMLRRDVMKELKSE